MAATGEVLGRRGTAAGVVRRRPAAQRSGPGRRRAPSVAIPVADEPSAVDRRCTAERDGLVPPWTAGLVRGGGLVVDPRDRRDREGGQPRAGVRADRRPNPPLETIDERGDRRTQPDDDRSAGAAARVDRWPVDR